MGKEFLNNLFRYYDMVLKIDNILGMSIKEKNISNYIVLQSIEKSYIDAKEKGFYFNLDSELKNNFTPLDIASQKNIDIFSKNLSFFEKAINLDGTKLDKKNSPDSIIDHDKFSYSSQNNNFQYGIAYNLISSQPYGKNKSLVPCFVVLFPTYDNEFKLLSPADTFLKIKEYLGIELDNDEQKRVSEIEIEPYLIFNSKILEPYSLETPDIELTTHDEVKEKVAKYTEKFNSSNYDIDFLQEEFIVAIPQNLNMGLTKLYTSIFEYKNINSLIKSYFQVHPRKESEFVSLEIDTNEIIDTSKVVSSYSKHFGAFDKNYALAATQREAFTCYLEDKKVLPINGAPGTGKTSLLRAIFGDYTVKNAIKTYTNYRENKSIIFTTPIVCSSTNNQALFNVSEGIDSGFLGAAKENEKNNLYQRWIDDVSMNDKEIKFKESMFVPSIKGRREKEFELTKSDILSINNTIAKNPIKFINEYFKYREIEISYDKPNKRTRGDLEDAAQYFYNRIVNNIKDIAASTKDIEREVSKLSQIEQNLIIKHTKRGIQEDLIKASLDSVRTKIIETPEILDEYEKIKNKLSEIDSQRQLLNESLEEIKIRGYKINDQIVSKTNSMKLLHQQTEIENSYINKTNNSPVYDSIFNKIKEKYQDEFYIQRQVIDNILKENIETIRKNSSILDKIAYGLFNSGKIKQQINEQSALASTEVQDLNINFYKEEFFVNDLEKSIEGHHQEQINFLNKQIDFIDKEIFSMNLEKSMNKVKIEEIQFQIKNNDVKKRHLQFKLDEQFDILSDDILSFEDINLLVEQTDAYIGLESLKERNKQFDTEERTDNFYYALHLLEALFFIEKANMWEGNVKVNNYNEKIIICPNCNEHPLHYTEEKNRFDCASKSCPAMFSFNNPNIPKELDRQEIEYILKHKKAVINKKTYCATVNDRFINIEQKESIANTGADFSFNDIYPVFPMINITCNSFGTIVSSKDNNEIQEDIFDFMLIDEAGTISPSKMVILNCAKRVMFFGDKEQLKPVFAYDEDVEKRILKDFFKTDDDILKASTYFSCAAKSQDRLKFKKNNNVMNIANSCCNYFLPYNKSKMEGDIWLKEHFRCQTPIVSISNEISYHNEILPKKSQHKKNHWKNLVFVEHEHTKSKNNTNEGEIQEIIKFIENNKEDYKDVLKTLGRKDQVVPEISDEDLYNAIGIITPFANQEYFLKERIRNAFGRNKESYNEPVIKVGTVHKYQGSEREIIIFSSVYNKENIGKTSNLFFNREDPDMINVAVTRAKEIFVLFGNKAVLEDENTYSGVMIKHIDKHMHEYIGVESS